MQRHPGGKNNLLGFTLVKNTLGVTAQSASLNEIIRDAASVKPLLAQPNR
jgi:hypothetical protein